MLRMRHLLLAVAILGSLLVSAAGFDFYKLSLVWPPSACNVNPRTECISKIPNMFTIHGLWPQFADDKPVPPYAKDPSCTNVTPVSADVGMTLLIPIENELKAYWPNLFTVNGVRDDQVFWRHEWEDHGMCSDYPTDPRSYFYETFSLTTRYNPIEVMGITPGDTNQYEVKTILENVKRKVGAYPQIACNTLPGVAIKQLWEIRFCFNRAMPPSVLRDCPKQLAGTCSLENELIRFPPVPPI